MGDVFDIAARVTTPLGLAGIIFIAIFFVLRDVVRRNKLPAVLKALSPEAVMYIIKGTLAIAILALLLAFIGFMIASLKSDPESHRRPGPGPEDVEYKVRVTNDAAVNEVVPNARVTVTAQGVDDSNYTDSNGFYKIKLSPSVESVHLRVEASGFQPYEANPTVRGKNFEDIRLKPNSPPPPQTPTPLPGARGTATQRSQGRTQTPAKGHASDLQRRREQALRDLDYRSPTPQQ